MWGSNFYAKAKAYGLALGVGTEGKLEPCEEWSTLDFASRIAWHAEGTAQVRSAKVLTTFPNAAGSDEQRIRLTEVEERQSAGEYVFKRRDFEWQRTAQMSPGVWRASFFFYEQGVHVKPTNEDPFPIGNSVLTHQRIGFEYPSNTALVPSGIFCDADLDEPCKTDHKSVDIDVAGDFQLLKQAIPGFASAGGLPKLRIPSIVLDLSVIEQRLGQPTEESVVEMRS